MTPEEIAKLARDIVEFVYFAATEAIDRHRSAKEERARCGIRVQEILTAHLAAREAEYARLRKVVRAVVDEVNESGVSGYHSTLYKQMVAALTPQQEQGK